MLFSKLKEMTTVSRNEENAYSGVHSINYFDDELIFKELHLRCKAVETQKMKMLRTKQDLTILNEENESISKSLTKIKTDCELYKSQLCTKLSNLRVSTDKQKLLSKNKLDDFYKKRKVLEQYYKFSPYKFELEELIDKNKILEEEWIKKTDLLELTKKQYDDLRNLLTESFKKKVCEFSDCVLKRS